MAEYVLSKKYQNHYGLDLKSDDLTRDPGFATNMRNAQYRKSGALEKRKGYQGFAISEGGFGMFNYNRIDPDTNIESLKAYTASDALFEITSERIKMIYTGTSTSVLVNLYLDAANDMYTFTIDVDGLNALTYNLGLGIDEVGFISINDLYTHIIATPNFATSTLLSTNATTTPASFMRVVRNFNVASEDLFLEAKSYDEVNCPVASPFAGSETHKNDDDFENISSVQLNNVLYLANGYDYTQKYDGQNLYRAGVPDVATLTSALDGAGAITGTNYFHRAQYIQYDAVGNIIEGNLATVTTGLNPVAQSINVTVANVVASTGFNTNCAIVNGAQAAVTTITVDDGSGGSHTIKVGDTAYFYDGVSVGYVERKVTAISGTTITISGAAVTVADNAVISNNLRIAIWRNETSGTTPTQFFEVAEIPNNSFATTQVYNDNLADASLGAELIEPLTDRSAPPKGKYISAFRNQLVIGGSIEAQNTLYWSDVESSEYFPNDGETQSDVQSISASTISGIAPNNEVFVIFQNPGIHVLSGDLANGNIRIDLISSDLGCSAHASIKEIKGVLYFLSDVGPRKMIGGQMPEPLGATSGDTQDKSSRIDPVFSQEGLNDDQILVKKRSIALHDRMGEKYILFVPCETESVGGDKYSNLNSTCYVYDYTRDAWLKWNNMDLSSGAIVFDDEILWQEKRLEGSDVDHYLYRQHNLSDVWDYEDHNIAVDFKYFPQWESLSEPSVFKRFLSVRIFSFDDSPTITGSVIGIQTEINFISDSPMADFTLDFGSDGYGQSEYGTAPYGDNNEPAQKHRLGSGRVRSERVVLYNNEDQQNIIINGWELEIATPYKLEFKS